MSVKIKIPPSYQDITHAEIVVVHGKTVGECLTELANRYPGFKGVYFDAPGRLTDLLAIFINGVSIVGDFADTPVKDGDEIFPMMLIPGG